VVMVMVMVSVLRRLGTERGVGAQRTDGTRRHVMG
jgi:hypothetical protein